MEPPLETMGLRGYLFCVFWEGHKIWGVLHWWGRVVVFLGGKASCLFNVFKKGNEFVFELGGGVFGEHFVCLGVL